MRRVFAVIVLSILLLTPAYPQVEGTGTSGDPYHGILEGDDIWPRPGFEDGTIYATDIVIPSGCTLEVSPDPLNGIHLEFIGQSRLTIGQGGTFILNPKASVTVQEIINNGSFQMLSEQGEPGVASLIHSEYSGNGTTEIGLYLKGGTTSVNDFRWHYISVPISGIDVNLFNTLNLAQYIESLVTDADNFRGWVAWDGYHYYSGDPMPVYSFQTLSLGKGYNFYSDYANNVITLMGNINIDDIAATVTCGNDYPDYQGYNLLGNPFASCLDWDELVTLNQSGDFFDAVYFTHEGYIASYVGGIGANGGTGTIPPMQGFFIKASGNLVFTLDADARVHNNDQLRYKKKSTGEISVSSDTISFLKLKLFNSVDSTEAVIRFNNQATMESDKLFDAFVFSKKAGSINIWTTISEVSYSINGLPYPTATLDLPVGININVPGTYRLSLSKFNRLDGYSFILKDLETGQTIDLQKGGFIELTVSEGLIEDRFILSITNNTTVIEEDLAETENAFRIYFAEGMLNLISLDESAGGSPASVKVYDLTGRVLYSENGIRWTGKGDRKSIHLKKSIKGICAVEIVSDQICVVRKIFIP